MDLNNLSADRFVGKVSQLLICPICICVLNDPVVDSKEHLFCRKCIIRWLKEGHSSCPIDRSILFELELKEVNRFLKEILSEQELTCDFKPFGCTSVVRLDCLEAHRSSCLFNPKSLIKCSKGCGLFFERQNADAHNCINELKKLNDDLKIEVSVIKQTANEARLRIMQLEHKFEDTIQKLRIIEKKVEIQYASSQQTDMQVDNYDNTASVVVVPIQNKSLVNVRALRPLLKGRRQSMRSFFSCTVFECSTKRCSYNNNTVLPCDMARAYI